MLNGLLVVNKPKNIGSHDLVYKLRRKLKDEIGRDIKIGHTGTLDPFAEGILVLCFGNATKVTEYLQGKDKVYIAELRLGLQTTSDDITGEIVAEKAVDESVFLQLENVVKKYIGTIEQKPPLYSAISVNGKRLYKYARANKSVKIPTRTVFVKSLEILELDKKNNLAKLKIECGSGTYIRALARDIGEDLGVGGTLQNLQRTNVGRFCLADSIQYSDDMADFTEENLQKKLISVEQIFEKMDEIKLTEIEFKKFVNGNIKFLNEDDKFNEHKIDGKLMTVMWQKNREKIKAVVKYSDDKFRTEYFFVEP